MSRSEESCCAAADTGKRAAASKHAMRFTVSSILLTSDSAASVGYNDLQCEARPKHSRKSDSVTCAAHCSFEMMRRRPTRPP